MSNHQRMEEAEKMASQERKLDTARDVQKSAPEMVTEAPNALEALEQDARAKWAREFRYLVYTLKTNWSFLGGLIIIGGMTLLAIFAPWIAPYNPEFAIPADFLQSPSAKHWFGTDSYGMDIFSRVIWAPRLDLFIAVGATFTSLAIGIPLGVWAGYYGEDKTIQGWGSEFLLRGMDIIQAFPPFVLAMALAAVLGNNATNVIIVIAFINVPIFLRLTRSAVLSIKEKPYVEAAKAVGNPDRRILMRHILPNSLAPALINASVVMGFSILLTAGLSFIGAGIRVPKAEWGSMISIGASDMITGEWWTSVFPGLFLGVTVFGFALLGDGLRIYLDPTRRR